MGKAFKGKAYKMILLETAGRVLPPMNYVVSHQIKTPTEHLVTSAGNKILQNPLIDINDNMVEVSKARIKSNLNSVHTVKV